MDFIKTPETRLNEDLQIEHVIQEFDAGIIDDVAWAKALKKAKGNESYAKALYIDERIQRIKDLHSMAPIVQKELDLKALEDQRELTSKDAKSFSFKSMVLIAFLSIITGGFYYLQIPEIAIYSLIVTALAVLFSLFWRSVLDGRTERITEQIDEIKNPQKSDKIFWKLIILTVFGLGLYYLFS